MTLLVNAVHRLRTSPAIRLIVLAGIDAGIWVVAVTLATLARFGFDPSTVNQTGIAATTSIAIVVFLLIGAVSGLYTGRHRLASFEEVGWLLLAAATTTTFVFLAAQAGAGPNLVPLSAVLAAGSYQLVGAFGARYTLRMILEKGRLLPHGSERILIFGAGEAGYQAARALLQDPMADAVPVGFLDDDRSKRSLRMMGLRVCGDRSRIAEAAKSRGATSLLIAVPTATHDELVDIADAAIEAGLHVKILPPLSQIAHSGIRVRDIRDIELADFLGREETHLDLEAIAGYVTGKVVMVTGAGGSIGSELSRTLLRFDPECIIALDHAENNLHRLRLSIGDPEACLKLELADIRDIERMHEVFTLHEPDVVFHAAAHKHVPFLEDFPDEAVKTNVYGTLNVLEAARKAKVERFVNISTDKAADPINQLGRTKRTGELLTSHFSSLGEGVYLSVRFGNVLGSEGSVIPTFREQLLQGRPLTVTHPAATRYFMTIPEACELVIQAGSMGSGQDLFILDMGEPVRIMDLAKRLSAALKPGIPPSIEITGLRPGEKLHEVLFNADDQAADKPHSRIWRCSVEPLNPAALNGDLSPKAARAKKVEPVTT